MKRVALVNFSGFQKSSLKQGLLLFSSPWPYMTTFDRVFLSEIIKQIFAEGQNACLDINADKDDIL